MKEEPRGRYLGVLAIGALGVVYGDIGTSPLYAMRECFSGPHGLPPSPGNILGVLSLIFWALIIVVSLKYLALILRADNGGEGGILALMTLAGPTRHGVRKRRQLLLALGVFGAALLYGDGMITPAISVLSAAEGLLLVTPAFERWLPLFTITVLLGIFLIQKRGTGKVGSLFGPITMIWFVVLAVLGVRSLVVHPEVLVAVNPVHGVRFFIENGAAGFVVLGSVFLVVTGGEALYADMGHFGRRPIRLAWFSLVLPALLLNYFGQGALLLATPEAAVNPFFRLVPPWGVLPLVALSTVATCIASQALISGAFSLTRQAVSLGLAPRLTIRHTSAREIGQIYVPVVNWALCAAAIGLVLGFETSSRLAAAYGIAVTTTMVITSLLFFVVLRELWRWGAVFALALSAIFLTVDGAFFAANVIKIPDGGWFPLVVAAALFVTMTTWRRGREILADRLREKSMPIETLVSRLTKEPPTRVPGTAIFCTRDPDHAPPALLQNLAHNRVLHERVGILTVIIEPVPRVTEDRRVVVESLPAGIFGVFLHYGFMESPDVPRALELARERRLLDVAPDDVVYFLGGESLRPTTRPGMALWRERLFAWLSRNAQRANGFFLLPSEQVVEIGTQVDL